MIRTGPYLFALTLPCSLAAVDLGLLQQKDMQPFFGRLGGARLAGLGGSHHAIVQGRDALMANPAGLGSLGELEIGLHHESWLGDLNHESVYVAAPLGARVGFGVFGHVTDFGVYDVRDSSGSKVGQGSARDFGLGIGLGLATRSGFTYGLTLRALRQSLEGQDAVGLVADAGAGWRSANGWTAGLAFLNGGLNAGTQGAERWRWALGRHLQGPWGLRWWPALGFSWAPQAGNRMHAGVEAVREAWSWRLGYQLHFVPSPDGSQGLSTGVGYRWGQLSVDYGILPFSDFGPAQTLSLAWSQPLISGGVAKARPLERSKAQLKGPPRVKAPSAELQSTVDVLAEAKALEKEGRISAAADAYEAATLRYPDLVGAWRGLADLRYRLHQDLAAVSAYQRLLELQPDEALRAWVDAYRAELERSLP